MMWIGVIDRLAWLWMFVALSGFGAPGLRGQDGDQAQIDLEIIDIGPAAPIPDAFTVRVRIVDITPHEPVRIEWRWGGEGASGKPVKGVFTRDQQPEAPAERTAEERERLPVGEWSAEIPITEFGWKRGRRVVLTVTAGPKGQRVSYSPVRFVGYPVGIEAEFEFRYRGQAIKTVAIRSDEGNVFGVVIPLDLLRDDVAPDSPDFTRRLTGLKEYELERREPLATLPWIAWHRPEKFLIVDSINGYRPFRYHGTRYTSRDLVYEMCKTLRLLGVNGLRSPPEFLLDDMKRRGSLAAQFSRGSLIKGKGYPVPSARRLRADGTAPEGAGCPYHPGVATRTAEAVEETLRRALGVDVEEVWVLTVDEIGNVVRHAPERKGHLTACPLCREGFREWLAGLGLRPTDFERASWNEVVPVNSWERDAPRPWLSDRGLALMAYYTRRFNCYASAKMFTPLRDACARTNDQKRQAMADPAKNRSAIASQPWIYSFALRGCTFLYGGHSLDFFNFYRHADNAFVYETSNRDPRVWSWDSYLCDVGRMVAAENGLEQGIYIKPHRGAVVQRALTAIARGVTMIYWYNFGPAYAKGDSYSDKPENLTLTSKAAALIGKTEDVLYGGQWMVPPDVGFVSPRSSEIWAGLGALPTGAAAHENAKWSYTALAHAHIPVDPLDEQMLVRSDLSRYKVLYILGPHLRRDAALEVARWVRGGGVLYTSGYGLARDEQNEPLEALIPVLGLKERGEPEIWTDVKAYHATAVQAFDQPQYRVSLPPNGAAVVPGGEYGVRLQPVVGREVLHPSAGAEVLARFQDGGAAVVRHPYGKGVAYVVGLWPGLEYSARVRRTDFDMTTDFDATLRGLIVGPALRAGVTPVVETSEAAVEGVLLRNPRTGKRAIALMNWAYRIVAEQKRYEVVSGNPRKSSKYVSGNAPAEDVRITVRGAGPVSTVTSAMLDATLHPSTHGDTFVVTVPSLAEGDVLLLD